MHDIVLESLVDGVLVLQLNHANGHNPVSRALERALVGRFRDAEADSAVEAVIITGGPERSFSAGGDFNEVKNLHGDAVERWIDGTIELYSSCLEISKPTIAAIDNYAIGIGFQLALTCDWRIGTGSCRLIMRELAKGIACTLGSYMLEKCLGRLLMQQIVLGCDPIEAHEALRLGLLNQVTTSQRLIDTSRAMARKLADYPAIPYRRTKRVANQSFVRGLQDIAAGSKAAHRESFEHRTAQHHFAAVLGHRYQERSSH